MKINLTVDPQANTYVEIMTTPARTPLGQRGRVEINHTLLRVVGKDQAPALDVAAFQSFAD